MNFVFFSQENSFIRQVTIIEKPVKALLRNLSMSSLMPVPNHIFLCSLFEFFYDPVVQDAKVEVELSRAR